MTNDSKQPFTCDAYHYSDAEARILGEYLRRNLPPQPYKLTITEIISLILSAALILAGGYALTYTDHAEYKQAVEVLRGDAQ